MQDDKTEFCFIGRSNSGKSTIINAIANKKIAKSSSMPGRTQLVNFFDCGKYRIVDLPGYGFAKVSKESKKYLSLIIEEYLLHRKNLFGVFQICDAN
ncbi:MAG: ribosome biogenesis GTP-binding protein YihA/YsxC, partial [Mycoplasmoidaceae bacterium]|nr:ribosome biogenesis GTP-binding protein YihA/YsxC [Mycoplasmoidaceae bacterium]